MEAIRTYVTGAFARVEPTQAALDQQAEIIADMEAQFAELVAEGKTEAEALGATIAGMGDLDEIVAGFPTVGSTVAAAPAAPTKVPKPEPVDVDVKLAKWQLLTTLGSVFLAMAGLLALAGFYTLAGGGSSAAGLLLMIATAGAVWKVWDAVTRFRAAPDGVGTVRVHDRPKLRSALMWWAGACFVAFVFNMAADSGGFWAWALWAVGAYWPLSIWVGERIALDGIVTVTPVEQVSVEGVAQTVA